MKTKYFKVKNVLTVLNMWDKMYSFKTLENKIAISKLKIALSKAIEPLKSVEQEVVDSNSTIEKSEEGVSTRVWNDRAKADTELKELYNKDIDLEYESLKLVIAENENIETDMIEVLMVLFEDKFEITE